MIETEVHAAMTKPEITSNVTATWTQMQKDAFIQRWLSYVQTCGHVPTDLSREQHQAAIELGLQPAQSIAVTLHIGSSRYDGTLALVATGEPEEEGVLPHD